MLGDIHLKVIKKFHFPIAQFRQDSRMSVIM